MPRRWTSRARHGCRSSERFDGRGLPTAAWTSRAGDALALLDGLDGAACPHCPQARRRPEYFVISRAEEKPACDAWCGSPDRPRGAGCRLEVRSRNGSLLTRFVVAAYISPMGRSAARGRGRPRKNETKLSRWLDSAGMSRDALSERLGVGRTYVDKMCRGERRPSLDLAVAIEKLTDGAVPVSVWTKVPPHSSD